MIAEKGNKVYVIDENQKEFYQSQGFDIKNNEGEIVSYGAGKTVSLEKYMQLKQENEELKKQLNEKQKSDKKDETKEVKDKKKSKEGE